MMRYREIGCLFFFCGLMFFMSARSIRTVDDIPSAIGGPGVVMALVGLVVIGISFNTSIRFIYFGGVSLILLALNSQFVESKVGYVWMVACFGCAGVVVLVGVAMRLAYPEDSEDRLELQRRLANARAEYESAKEDLEESDGRNAGDGRGN